MADFATALTERPLVLDGGFGTLLEARGNDLSGSLWSARLLRDDPAEVCAAHAEFIAAGADVVITSSYQLGFGVGLDDDEVERLLRRSVTVARDAGDAFVAASVGPYGAVRADGSEYTGDYGVGVEELRQWHRRRLEVLAASGADALAVETIPSLAEVEALTAELVALDRPDLPVWISLSAASTAFDETSLAAAFTLASTAPGVVAVGVNCCAPASVLPSLALAPNGIATVVYPNSGERWDALKRRWHGEPGVPTALAAAWVDAGARLVGGCCRTTPAHIAALAAALR
jgi:homocysteine S-methyltransferase